MKKLCNAEFEPHERYLEYEATSVYTTNDGKCEVCGHKAEEHKLVCHQNGYYCYDTISTPKWYERLMGHKPKLKLKALRIYK